MLKKKVRLTRREFPSLRGGRLIHSPSLSLRYAKLEGVGKFSVVVSSKIAKKAHQRNKIRRIVYSAIGNTLAAKSSKIKGIFYAKTEIKNINFKEVMGEVEKLLSSAGAI